MTKVLFFLLKILVHKCAHSLLHDRSRKVFHNLFHNHVINRPRHTFNFWIFSERIIPSSSVGKNLNQYVRYQAIDNDFFDQIINDRIPCLSPPEHDVDGKAEPLPIGKVHTHTRLDLPGRAVPYFVLFNLCPAGALGPFFRYCPAVFSNCVRDLQAATRSTGPFRAVRLSVSPATAVTITFAP